MNRDECAGLVAGGELLGGQRIRPMTPLVFSQVVSVRGLQPPKDIPAQGARDDPLDAFTGAGPGPPPGDLEVNEGRLSMLVDQDILAFFKVDIGDVPAMQLIEQMLEAAEERIVHMFSPLKRMAVDERMNQAGASPLAQTAWHALYALRRGVDGQLVVRKDSPKPGHRQAEKRRGPANLEDRQT